VRTCLRCTYLCRYMHVCLCEYCVRCAQEGTGADSVARGNPGKTRGFSLTHIEGGWGEGPPSGRTTRQPPVRSFARWWRVVCLFVSREWASGGYRKKFYLHDRKMFSVRKSERSRGSEEDAASHPFLFIPRESPPSPPSGFTFFLHPGERKRGGS